MRQVIIGIGLLIALSGCSTLYPGLTMGPCGPHDVGKVTVYDFGGVQECVPKSSVASRGWLD